jgi:hypothetical protein
MLAATSIIDDRNYGDICELAELPDMVRGYENIKLRNVARYVDEVRRIAAIVEVPSFLGETLLAVADSK